LLITVMFGCAGAETPAPAPPQPVEPTSDVPTVEPAAQHPAGRVTWRRLNRNEYNNTVRDLLGTRLRPARDFPDDDTAFGFDNISAVLSLSPLHLELYERAADLLVADILRHPLTAPLVLKAEAEHAEADAGAPYRGSGWTLFSAGSVSGVVDLPLGGPYRFSVRAFSHKALGVAARMELHLDGARVGAFYVDAPPDSPGVYSVDVEVTPGAHTLTAVFTNDYYEPQAAENRQLVVDWLAMEGPLDLPDVADAPRSRVMICTPQSRTDSQCARTIVSALAGRAWRRPIAGDELDRLMELFTLGADDGLEFEAALSLPLKGVLLSPHFTFMVELAEDPAAPTDAPLSDYEIATRLSYFVWASMPDDALFAAAAAGELQTDDGIITQVRRMLADPRADALAENLAGQWLFVRNIDNHTPANWIYPEFDEPLRQAMKAEMSLFFGTFLSEDRPITELLTATDTFVNDRLADHYGLPRPGTDHLTRVDLTGTQRGGLLTQGGLLMVTSAPARTSPVKRGAWVLKQLLCAEPPPPPPGVEGLDQAAVDGGAQTIRDILEQHRADPACAGCHDLIDPIGFGLENFDGIGGWRDTDAGFPIDATSELTDGTPIDGAHSLAQALAVDFRFIPCALHQLMTYGLGRGLTKDDRPALDEIESQWTEQGLTVGAAVELIALSRAFRFRAGEAAAP